MLKLGLYEQLINGLIARQLDKLDTHTYYVKDSVLDKEEAARFLSQYLSEVLQVAFASIREENKIEKQIEITNRIINLLNQELNTSVFSDDLVEVRGRVLNAVFSRLDNDIADLDGHIGQITPYTRFSQSELFIGGNNRTISLESELKKEIRSADEICFLVSFIKYGGIRVFQKDLEDFTNNGGRLKVITSSYMGATDLKAVQYLSRLKNTEVKVSYNTQSERLHAKAYLFLRNTGYHTGYIGSSNLSRSAITNGLEWNLKVTTKEISHIIKKFKDTFEAYWMDDTFEYYDDQRDVKKLEQSLRQQKSIGSNESKIAFFDLTPFHYQKEILDKLVAERTIHKRYRNLIVAATGTGKTVIAAFDYKEFKDHNTRARLLFVAHRREILEQALATFRGILKDGNFGELWVDGYVPTKYDVVFASVQTLNSQLEGKLLSSDYYDYVIIDEVHHIAASSYRPILDRFKPQILLGLTATPERMDNENILADFCDVVAAEIRLPEALNRELLCPFQYFGISDSIDLSKVKWERGKYASSELAELYINNEQRVSEILSNMDKYLTDINSVKALGFCVSQDHAKYMAESFRRAGLHADYLTSENSSDREDIRLKLLSGEINYLFVVDIFNEGVDIPEVDTVLFLRPTESLTVFLQQLGRGLRKAKGKECLTVLDFVGNSRPEYDFDKKFRALIGKTNTTTLKEVEDDFPHLPLNCSIVLERKAKEYILNNIRNAVNPNRKQLLEKIRSYKHNINKPLTLKNFTEDMQVPVNLIYKKDSWNRLCADAGVRTNFDGTNESEITRAISKKWLQTNSFSYFSFILSLARQNFDVDVDLLNESQQIMCLMLHYDVWQDAGGFNSISESIRAIGQNEVLVGEIIEAIDILISRVDFVEKEIQLHYSMPLKLHGRYTREQILSAFGFHTFRKRQVSQAGVINIHEKNTELLFVTLEKSEKEYSPTTLYDDYAISERLFHWQSQNAARPDSGAGLAYIQQSKTGKVILLFVRERNQDEFGNTMGYVFLGNVNYLKHYNEKPMSITWELNEPIPQYMWKESAKLSAS